MRDDELTRRWLAEAERQRDFPRTEMTLAAAAGVLGDTAAGAHADACRGGAVSLATQEIESTRSDLAILAGADDAEALNEQAFRATADVPG